MTLPTQGHHARLSDLEVAVIGIVEILVPRDRSTLAEYVRAERLKSSQAEWERWKRANGVAAAGLRANADELRVLAQRQGESSDERDLLRMAEVLTELAVQLEGDNWLRSPFAMAELRSQEHRAGAAVGGSPNSPTPPASITNGERLTP